VTASENLRVSLAGNPIHRKWDGKDLNTLLRGIPLDRVGHFHYEGADTTPNLEIGSDVTTFADSRKIR